MLVELVQRRAGTVETIQPFRRSDRLAHAGRLAEKGNYGCPVCTPRYRRVAGRFWRRGCRISARSSLSVATRTFSATSAIRFRSCFSSCSIAATSSSTVARILRGTVAILNAS